MLILNNRTLGLMHPSREMRDTLLIMGLIGLTILPLGLHLPYWTGALVISVLLWKGWITIQRRTLPPKWVLAGLLCLTMFALWLQFRTLLGRDPGIALIVILLSLKTLEWRRRRDAWVIFYLAFFTLLSNFLYSQSIAISLWMTFLLWAWLAALTLIHRPVGRPSLRSVFATSFGMTVTGLPVVVLLFLLFPRFAPLWNLPADSTGRSGLSSRMEIGRITQLALDDAIAMRIEWLNPATMTPISDDPPKSDLYFRGPVLSAFDGRQWQAAIHAGTMPTLKVLGAPLAYQITLEPHHINALLTLDVSTNGPQELSSLNARPTPQGQWISNRNIDSLVKYRATSHTKYLLDAQAAAVLWKTETYLPPGFNPRTSELGQQIYKNHPTATARELAATVLDKLKSGGYVYTLDPGEYGLHSADEFWFDRKRGFCEHIASSFVILMRAMRVPARIVTGYQGGEKNPIDGLWTVRQSDAHAWAEIWQSGEGWIRIDPTAAVAPERIGDLTRLTPRPGLVSNVLAGVFGTPNEGIAQYARALWEATNNVWNQQILSFNQQKQLKLLENVGFDAPQWADLIKIMGWGIASMALLAAIASRARRLEAMPPWNALLRAAQLRLNALGMSTPNQLLTPAQLALRATTIWDKESASICEWLHDMEKLQYAPKADISHFELERRYKRLKWPPALTKITEPEITADSVTTLDTRQNS